MNSVRFFCQNGFICFHCLYRQLRFLFPFSPVDRKQHNDIIFSMTHYYLFFDTIVPKVQKKNVERKKRSPRALVVILGKI